MHSCDMRPVLVWCGIATDECTSRSEYGSVSAPLGPGFLTTSASIKGTIYALEKGVLFTKRSTRLHRVVRRAATIMIAVGPGHLEVRLGRQRLQLQAYAVAPLVEHTLRSENSGMVGVCVHPDHPHYRRFRRVGERGLLPLDPAMFGGLERGIESACYETLGIESARVLFNAIIAVVSDVLPPGKPLDTRVSAAMDILWHNSNYPLIQLAADVGLSYHRMSRLFSESIGLSIRSYQLWLKMLNVAPLLEMGYTLAESAEKAGFTDVSHLCRVYRQAFGAPPSYIHNNDRIRYVSYRMAQLQIHPDAAASSRKVVAA